MESKVTITRTKDFVKVEMDAEFSPWLGETHGHDYGAYRVSIMAYLDQPKPWALEDAEGRENVLVRFFHPSLETWLSTRCRPADLKAIVARARDLFNAKVRRDALKAQSIRRIYSEAKPVMA